MEQLMEILESIRPDVDFANEEHLIDDRILDSFDIVSLVSELNNAFDIEINVEDLLPENFNSASAMMKMIDSLRA